MFCLVLIECPIYNKQEREFKAVHAVKNLDINLLKYILEPSRLVEIGKHYSDDVSFFFFFHHCLVCSAD